MSRQNLRIIVRIRLGRIFPKLDLAVAPSSNKPPCSTGLVTARAENLSWCDSRGPAHAVHATAACLEDLIRPVVVFEFEDRDATVGGSACEETPGFVWRPGYEVHGGFVQGDFVDFGPLTRGFAPDEDFAVVGGRGEDVAVFRVGLSGVSLASWRQQKVGGDLPMRHTTLRPHV